MQIDGWWVLAIFKRFFIKPVELLECALYERDERVLGQSLAEVGIESLPFGIDFLYPSLIGVALTLVLRDFV